MSIPQSVPTNSPAEIPILAPALDLNAIVRLEPLVASILANAWTDHIPGRKRHAAFQRWRRKLASLVGHHARLDQLRSCEAYTIVINELSKAMNSRRRARR